MPLTFKSILIGSSFNIESSDKFKKPFKMPFTYPKKSSSTLGSFFINRMLKQFTGDRHTVNNNFVGLEVGGHQN